MASMNRNVSLEEINTDAFMGITYLNYQSLAQKVIFVGGIVVAVGGNLIGTFIFNIGVNVSVFLTFIPLLISKPSKAYYSRPVEDLEQLHNSAAKIREEEELRKKQQEKMSDEAQKKLLIKIGIGVIIAIFIFIVLVMIVKSTKKDELHHTVPEAYYIEVWSKNV